MQLTMANILFIAFFLKIVFLENFTSSKQQTSNKNEAPGIELLQYPFWCTSITGRCSDDFLRSLSGLSCYDYK